MQDKSKILYEAIGILVKEIREEKNMSYTDFCYGNGLPMSTYNDLMKAKSEASCYTLSRFIKGLGMNFEEFGARLDKALPKDFWEDED